MRKELSNLVKKELAALVRKTPTVVLLFYALYILIAAATFRHTAWGFGTIEGEASFSIWGYVAALAVDAGMMLSATGLREWGTKNAKGEKQASRFWLVLGLLVSAVASTFTQWLFATAHAQPIVVAEGAQWWGWAKRIGEIRVVILPFLLPALSVIYAFCAKNGHQHTLPKTNVITEASETDLDVALLQNKSVKARCKMAWAVHGLEASAADIAGIIGCHTSTASRARKEIVEVLEKLGETEKATNASNDDSLED